MDERARHAGRVPAGRQPLAFLARLTSCAALGGSDTRWKYAWSEVCIDDDSDDQLVSHGRSGTTSANYAINLCEINNIDEGAGVQGNGVDQSGADYPATFHLRPAGGQNVANDVVVMMWAVRDSTGQRRYVFQYENEDDGVCS